MDNKLYRIEKVTDCAKFEGLRALWSKVFGDPEEFVDGLYEAFGSDVTGYVVTNAEGRVVSALTLYLCGNYKHPAGSEAVPVYVSYAVCTDPEFRGLGLAGELVGYARDLVTGKGGLSLVSPAEESLQKYYEALGYKPFLMANESIAYPDFLDDEDFEDEDDDFEAFDPGLSIMPCDTSVYNMYREAFLSSVPHIEISDKMLGIIKAESRNGDGMFIINGGDAICIIGESEDGEINVTELLVNPMLMAFSLEIEEEIAARLAKYLGLGFVKYRSTGYGKCQSMVSGDMRKLMPEVDTDDRGEDVADEGGIMSELPPYYGFPLD